jgi:hydrogenase expression/formation protein HypD
MKYLSEYRNIEDTQKVLKQLEKSVSKPWNIMEICGGQTHGLVRNGILDLLPDKIRMIHGPGCPVCVTPLNLIDKAIELLDQGVIVCSFGDMIRVPGSKKSLLEAKAEGGDLRILYSPLEAVKIARNNPNKEVVFFAVGFETTAPANALSVLHAQKEGLTNYSILVSHVLVPPAMEAILDDEFNSINAF